MTIQGHSISNLMLPIYGFLLTCVWCLIVIYDVTGHLYEIQDFKIWVTLTWILRSLKVKANGAVVLPIHVCDFQFVSSSKHMSISRHLNVTAAPKIFLLPLVIRPKFWHPPPPPGGVGFHQNLIWLVQGQGLTNKALVVTMLYCHGNYCHSMFHRTASSCVTKSVVLHTGCVWGYVCTREQFTCTFKILYSKNCSLEEFSLKYKL